MRAPGPRALAALVASTLALALLAATPGAAQDSGSQSNPLVWTVAADEEGFITETAWNFTKGDWVRLDFTNLDEVRHSLRVPGLGIDLSVAAYDEGSATVQLTQSGVFEVQDEPTGDRATVQVVDADVVDYEQGLVDEAGTPAAQADGATSSKSGIPAIEIGVVVGVLALAVMLVRKA